MLLTTNARFNPESMALGRSVHAFSNFRLPGNFTTFIEFYPQLHENVELIMTERRIWIQHMLSMEERVGVCEENPTMSSHIGRILAYMVDVKFNGEIPHFYEVLVIAGTIAFSSASCERSFSALNILKTALRATMSDSRLKGCVNRDILEFITNEDLVNAFALIPRRINL